MNPAMKTASYSCRIIQGFYRSGNFTRDCTQIRTPSRHRYHITSCLTKRQSLCTCSQLSHEEDRAKNTKQNVIIICNNGLLSNRCSEKNPLSPLYRYCDVHQVHRSLSRYSSLSTCGDSVLSSLSTLSSQSRHVQQQFFRGFHSSSLLLKEESKVEKTVKALKDQAVEEARPALQSEKPPPAPVKKSIGQRIMHELKHYYHGFRLLVIDVRVCFGHLWEILNGKNLTRRQRRQLVRTTADLFRLVPFLVFIIVPFMEFLLPVAIKLFPNMLPSTFKEENKEQEKLKKKLKVKLEMAKFLQDTLEESALQKKDGKEQKSFQEFAAFMDKIRSAGMETHIDEILKYSKLFEDEITLDSMGHGQLMALCRLLDLPTIGTNNFLRFQLRMKLRQLEADDRMIQKEGIDSLAVWELQEACRNRGMRALGVSTDRLKIQLNDWLYLHLNEKVPTSLLLLSRALYLPETLSTEDQLKATISALPESATTEAKVKVSEVAGERVDHKAKLELIKQEEQAIKEEKEQEAAEEQAREMERVKEVLEKEEELAAEQQEQEKREVKETLVDTAPVLEDKAKVLEEKVEKPAEMVSPKDIEELEEVLDTLAKEKRILIEKNVVQEAQEEYKEDLEDLKEVIVRSGGDKEDLKESKAAKRLGKQVNRMVQQIDSVIENLHREKEAMLEDIEVKQVRVRRSRDLLDNEERRQEVLDQISEDKKVLIGINELVLAMRRLQKIPNATKLQQILEVVQALDDDKDGAIDLQHTMKVLEMIGQENVKIDSSQMKEIVTLLHKEVELEREDKQKELEEKQIMQETRVKDEEQGEGERTEVNSKQ